ncbi:MAG: alpha/beta hydrolase [Atopobiaceae bacterium]
MRSTSDAMVLAVAAVVLAVAGVLLLAGEPGLLAQVQQASRTGVQENGGDAGESQQGGQDVLSASMMDESALGEEYMPTSEHIEAYVPSAEEVERFEAILQGDFTDHIVPDASLAAGTVAAPESIEPGTSQVFYLWDEGNMPGGDARHGRDPQGFRPAVTTVPAAAGTQMKGAVLLEAGGAFLFRGARGDAYPVADELAARGYQCFVVDYRLTRDLGAIDLARAMRFVRAHWREYGLPSEQAIAVMGFSAGGIAAGQMLLDWDGTTSPEEYDGSYVPDSLDAVSADAAADGMIYSFYGRLSVASKDADELRAGNLPPTYFVYGSRDPFVHEFEANIETLEEAGVEVEGVALRGWPHGFGARGGWIDGYCAFLDRAFAQEG